MPARPVSFLLWFPLFWPLLCIQGCSSSAPEPSGPRPTGGFTSIVNEGGVDVHVVVAPSAPEGVSVTCKSPESESRVSTRVDQGTLYVDSRSSAMFGIIHFGRHESCVVDVKVQKLVSVTTRGSGDVEVDGGSAELERVETRGSGDVTVSALSTERLALRSSGSGNIRIHSLTANEVVAHMSGSGELEAAGKAKSLRVQSSGSGDLHARSLMTEESRVEASGSGDIALYTTRRADIRTHGSGDVVVAGKPAERVCEAHGSGDISWE
jgi:hypothetical protein